MRFYFWLTLLGAGVLLAACAHQAKPAASKAPQSPAEQKQEAQIEAGVAKAKEALKKGEKITNPNEVCTLYFMAAAREDRELLGLLKRSGADINTRNTMTQETALILTVLEGTPRAVRLLLDQGADPTVENSRRRSAIYEAVCSDNLEVSKILLEHGANPNTIEIEHGTTALLAAAMDGKREIVKLLLEHGANPNLAGQQGGATALHLAVLKGHQDVVEDLLEHGANPNARTQAGTTPLKTAEANHWPEIARLLKRHGAQ